MMRNLLKMSVYAVGAFLMMYINHTMDEQHWFYLIIGLVALILLEVVFDTKGKRDIYQILGLGLGMLTYSLVMIRQFSWPLFFDDLKLFVIVVGVILILPRIYFRQNQDQRREDLENKYRE